MQNGDVIQLLQVKNGDYLLMGTFTNEVAADKFTLFLGGIIREHRRLDEKYNARHYEVENLRNQLNRYKLIGWANATNNKYQD